MGFDQDQIVPLLINWSMRQKNLAAYRARIIPAAEGRVLEIGIGSGLNLPFYSRNVARVIGLEPSARLLAMARRVERAGNGSVEFIEGSAEAIPLPDASVDTVVTTWTLCSIPDALRALRDMRRVLRPGGRPSFVEHGRVPDRIIIWWLVGLTPGLEAPGRMLPSQPRHRTRSRAPAFNSMGGSPATYAAETDDVHVRR